MQILERTKEEIQKRSERMSDFLRMEYFEECSKKINSIEAQKFCYLELVKLYERKSMFTEAIKYVAKLRQLSITENERTRLYLVEILLLIKGGFYDNADCLYRKFINSAKQSEKLEIKKRFIEMFKKEAEKLEKAGKVSHLLKVYEKLIMIVPDIEKKEIQSKILVLYKRLGKIREFLELEKRLKNESFTPQPSQPYKKKFHFLSNHP